MSRYHYISDEEASFLRRSGTLESELELIELKRAHAQFLALASSANDNASPPTGAEGKTE